LASNKGIVPHEVPPPPSSGPRNNLDVDFKGERCNSDTDVSKTDPDSLLTRKSKYEGANPSYAVHVLMENRNSLAVDVRLTLAAGTAEHCAALDMLDDRSAPIPWTRSSTTIRRMSCGTRRASAAARTIDALLDMRVTAFSKSFAN
jgi:hypothetical protein